MRLLLLWVLALPSALYGATIHNIIVDQFGYRTAAEKYVIFCDPQTGQFSELPAFNPGTQFEVRRQSDGGVVFTGTIAAWNGGATDSESGDKVWQGQFNALATAGAYYISLPGGTNPGDRSYTFEIRDDIYAPVLKASARMYFYQRCGLDVPAANGGHWNHAACHRNANQDLAAQLWNGAPAGSPRDVHGGWHDAGDYGKYVEFTHGVLWDLMHAVEWYPAVFPDNTNIPESGNGVPDLLDEVKQELDWLLRMQLSDGSVCGKIGITDYADGASPPNSSTAARYYTQPSTSATATLAASCALRARLFAPYGTQYPGYSATLQAAAVNAWNFLAGHANQITYNNSGLVNADSNVSLANERQRRVCAAAELFALTGNATYRSYVDANYNSSSTTENGHQPILNNYFETGTSMTLQRGLVSYALTPGATAAVVAAIKTSLKNGIEWNVMGQAGNDPYRAFMWDGHYCWGSNQLKATWGMLPLWGIKLNVDATRSAAYLARAEEYLHYFHGRNPLNLVYLSNMGSQGANAGAEASIMEYYHSWFQDGSALYDGAGSTYGPAPGYLGGGPNQYYSGGVTPPTGQPPMKAYVDWNTGWPQNSWEVTEPAIYYQAAYTFLVAAFTSAPGNQPPVAKASANPTSGLAPLAVSFSSAGSSDPDGTIAAYQWNFGDGAPVQAGASVSHTYAAGSYTATLTVTDNAGATASATVGISALTNQPPVAKVSANPTSGLAPLGVSFSSAGSSDPDGTIAAYLWNFGDGSPVQAGASVSHTYAAGSYTATLTVTDNAGSTASATVGISALANRPPVIDSFPWMTPNPVTLPATATVSVTASDPDSGPSPLTYTWSKVSGPGTAGFSPNASTTNSSTVSFSSAGSYVLRVTVSDGAASASGDVTVTVNPAPVSALAGYWTLNEASGARADSSGNGNTLTDSGAVGSAPGKAGLAASFSGANYLSRGDAQQQGLDASGALTLAAWIKPVTVSGQNRTIIGKFDYGNRQRSYRLQIISGKLALFLSSTGGNYVRVNSASALAVNQWYHVAATFDGGSKTVKLYVNGSLDRTASISYTALFNSSAPFALGADFKSGVPMQFFSGLIDEARVYTTVLSQSEIQGLMGP